MAAADLTVIEGAGPLQAVDQIFEVPIELIEIGERLRPVDPAWAADLGKIMLVEGQHDPIKICRLPGKANFRLVIGGHRLEGRRLTAQATVKAVFMSADALDRRAAEISESLFRRDLEPIDAATFVAELIHVQKVKAGIDPLKDGRSISAKARWAQALNQDAKDATDIVSVAFGLTADVADQLGLTERTIRRHLELHRGLRPDVVAQLRGHPIAKNAGQLRALAKMAEADQRQAAILIFEGKAKGASDALAILRQTPKPNEQAKHLSAFLGSFSRMGQREKWAAMAMLAQQDAPPKMKALLAPFLKGAADEG